MVKRDGPQAEDGSVVPRARCGTRAASYVVRSVRGMTGRTHALDLVPGLRELARAQLGVVRRDQLRDLGVTRHHVRRQLDAQRWMTIGPRAVVLQTGPLSTLQRWSVAVAHAGPGSWLAGRTALERRGMTGPQSSGVHVNVPHGHPPLALPWLVVHQATHVAESDVELTVWPPCSTAARAAVDAARWQRSEEIAAGIVLAAVQQRLTTPDAVLEVVGRLPRVRHSARLREALRHAAEGADSLGEVDVAEIVQSVGLGIPRRQVLIMTPDGARPADLVVDLPDGRLLVIEVDGPHHTDPAVRIADAAKDASFIAAGAVVLRIPWSGGRRRRDEVRAQLMRIAAASQRRAI